ncbi:ATP-binding protein [Vulgatibacter sp.]|uniref:ATP-binding protein n=1 Tax=Vulgatibacter sp. TaxID=1971226 RepID=UPI003561EFDA
MSESNDFKNMKAPIGDLIRQVEQQLASRGGPVPERSREGGCSRCGGRGFVLGREGSAAVAQLCGCDVRCAACGGKGFLLEMRGGYQFHSRCECQTLAQRVAAYNAAQIPARFSDKGFERYYVEGSSGEPVRELMKAKRDLMQFADTARPGHTTLGIGLLGGPGRGKTHLLAATLSRLTLGRGVQCRYIEISFLFADLKAAISDPRARATVDKIEELAAVDVLAIDELGKGRGSTFEEEVLDELIGRRYNNGRLTLFATNYPREEQEPTRDGKQELWHQSLRTRVGERVYSRLHEMVAFIEFSRATPDRRIPG